MYPKYNYLNFYNTPTILRCREIINLSPEGMTSFLETRTNHTCTLWMTMAQRWTPLSFLRFEISSYWTSGKDGQYFLLFLSWVNKQCNWKEKARFCIFQTLIFRRFPTNFRLITLGVLNTRPISGVFWYKYRIGHLLSIFTEFLT